MAIKSALELDSRSLRILKDMRSHPKKAKKGAMKGLWFAGKELEKDVKDKIKDRSTKTGRYYKYKGRRLRASAAGEYPANRSGNLRKSVGFDVLSSEDMEFGYRTSVDYGKYIEQGTKRMDKRPALDKTVQRKKIYILNIIGREIEKELSKL